MAFLVPMKNNPQVCSNLGAGAREALRGFGTKKCDPTTSNSAKFGRTEGAEVPVKYCVTSRSFACAVPLVEYVSEVVLQV